LRLKRTHRTADSVNEKRQSCYGKLIDRTWKRQSEFAWQHYVILGVTEWWIGIAMAEIAIPNCTHLHKEA